MQSDSLSLDILKDNLLHAIDAEYNVIKAEIVLDIICQLEKMEITKDQLQTTRLGREINTIRQKIDAQKNHVQQIDKSSELFIEIAQRAKKLLRSWQGLLNNSSSSIDKDTKPRLILKVKFNSSITKRKCDSDFNKINEINIKRKKFQTSISPIILTETNNSLPRLKTTQQLLMEMQINQPNILSTQTSTINAILEKKIIDESLHDTIKLDYSALHHGRDLNNINTNSINFPKQLSSPSNTNLTSGVSLKRQSSFIRCPSSNINWENGSSAGSPLSPLSPSSSSSISSTTSWPISESLFTVPIISTNKHDEQSTRFSSDLATICASYNTVAELVQDHRRRTFAEHDSRELEARPDLLLVPIDQLAFVYEREGTKELNLSSELKHSSMTTVEKLHQSSDLIALPFIDCPLEFDLILDELIVQYPTINI